MKFILIFLLFYSSGVFAMPEEVFLVGDDLYYGQQKIPSSFIIDKNLEDYASSGGGNIAFFNIVWKEQGSDLIKSQDIFIEQKIAGFESFWDKPSSFHTIVKANNNLKGENVIRMYQQRGHTCTDTEITDILPSTSKKYTLNKSTITVAGLPYNFKHSEHYFLDFLFFNRGNSNILKTTQSVEFALLNIISTNSSCNNCFRSLWTLLSGEKKCLALPSLKEDFLKILFGSNAVNNTPLHILYTTAKFPSYRNSEITEIWKQNREFIDLADEVNALFIQRCFPLEKEKTKPISMIIKKENFKINVTINSPKKAIVNLYKQINEKDQLLKKIIKSLYEDKNMDIKEISLITKLSIAEINDYLE